MTSSRGGGGLCTAAWLGSPAVALRHARGERRAQLKWLISGAVLSVVGGAASIWFSESRNSALVQTIGNVLAFGLLAFPLSIGVAVMHYRLYDIDRLISRALSYAILTGLLIGTFIGLIALTTDAVEIDMIRADLLDAVNHAVQPTHASVWIRPRAHT